MAPSRVNPLIQIRIDTGLRLPVLFSECRISCGFQQGYDSSVLVPLMSCLGKRRFPRVSPSKCERSVDCGGTSTTEVILSFDANGFEQ
jgi:hypothetical protein